MKLFYDVCMSRKIMTTIMTKKLLLLMMIIMMGLMKPADGRVNVTAGRAYMRSEWFNPKYVRQSMEPYERYFFEQVSAI